MILDGVFLEKLRRRPTAVGLAVGVGVGLGLGQQSVQLLATFLPVLVEALKEVVNAAVSSDLVAGAVLLGQHGRPLLQGQASGRGQR